MIFLLGCDVRVPLAGVKVTSITGAIVDASVAAVVSYTLYGADGLPLATDVPLTFLSAGQFAFVVDKAVFATQLAQSLGRIVVKFAENGADSQWSDTVQFINR